jgi:hypothetical protein
LESEQKPAAVIFQRRISGYNPAAFEQSLFVAQNVILRPIKTPNTAALNRAIWQIAPQINLSEGIV